MLFGEVVPITKIRSLVAEGMIANQPTTAPVTLANRGNADNLMSVREQFKSASSPII
jgi:pyruvate/2-oxoglutarate dehydrogenase complex dihydrolipoamide acyltransferase (E2) component